MDKETEKEDQKSFFRRHGYVHLLGIWIQFGAFLFFTNPWKQREVDIQSFRDNYMAMPCVVVEPRPETRTGQMRVSCENGGVFTMPNPRESSYSIGQSLVRYSEIDGRTVSLQKPDQAWVDRMISKINREKLLVLGIWLAVFLLEIAHLIRRKKRGDTVD